MSAEPKPKTEAELAAEAKAAYDKQLETYHPRGSFAGVSIKAFQRFVRGTEIDEAGAKVAFNLTDEMLPFLMKELEAANMFGSYPAKLASLDDKTLTAHASGCQVVGTHSNGDKTATLIWKCVEDCPAKSKSLQLEQHEKKVAKAAEEALKNLPKDELVTKAEEVGVDVKAKDTKADLAKKIAKAEPKEEPETKKEE